MQNTIITRDDVMQSVNSVLEFMEVVGINHEYELRDIDKLEFPLNRSGSSIRIRSEHRGGVSLASNISYHIEGFPPVFESSLDKGLGGGYVFFRTSEEIQIPGYFPFRVGKFFLLERNFSYFGVGALKKELRRVQNLR